MKQTRIFTSTQIQQLCEYFTEIDGIIYHDNKPIKPYPNQKGYLKVRCPKFICSTIKKKPIYIYVARLVWILHNKNNPDIVDHIDHCITNNKIENLRNSTHSQNGCNRTGSAKTGKNVASRSSIYLGVSKRTKIRSDGTTFIRWRARTNVNEKFLNIGHYSTEIEAAKARDAYIRKHAPPEDLEFYKFNFDE